MNDRKHKNSANSVDHLSSYHRQNNEESHNVDQILSETEVAGAVVSLVGGSFALILDVFSLVVCSLF